jgi:hypothetical protein
MEINKNLKLYKDEIKPVSNTNNPCEKTAKKVCRRALVRKN